MSKASSGEDSPEPTSGDVDWPALWDEFGFDTEDGGGYDYISKTQLLAALECTDQECSSGQDIIDAAVDGVVLVEQNTDEGDLRGYVLVGGGQ